MIDRDPGKISVPVKSAYLPGSRSRPKSFKCTEIATGISLIKFLKFSFDFAEFLDFFLRRGGEGGKEQRRGGEEEKRRLGEVERKRKGGEELIGGGRGDLRRGRGEEGRGGEGRRRKGWE